MKTSTITLIISMMSARNNTVNRFRRWFPTVWVALAGLGVGHAATMLVTAGISYSWLAALTGCSAVLATFVYMYTSGEARTSENLPLLHTFTALAPLLILYDLLNGNNVSYWPLFYSVVVAYAGTLLYLRWYSKFHRQLSPHIQPGADMPEFCLMTLDGELLSRDKVLAGKATVLMFVRGNWCPLCMGQVKELAEEYRMVAEMGAQVIVVSSQPARKSQKLAWRVKAPIQFLLDNKNRAAETLGILHEKGAFAGTELLGYKPDVAYPTTLIINAAGRILYSDQTDNYRLRPEPSEFIQVLEMSNQIRAAARA